MKRILIYISATLLCCRIASAQEPADSTAQVLSPEDQKRAIELLEAERAEKHKEEVEDSGKKLRKTKYKGWGDYRLAYVADSLENELAKIKARESEIESNREHSEQLLKSAELNNASASELRAQLEKKVADADRNAARFCFIRLSQRYKPEWHEEVMEIIPTITTGSVINEYSPSFELLKVYPKYYAEVKGVIEGAYKEGQTLKGDDSKRNAFFTKWTNAIKSTEYYKQHFNSGNNIYYLNQQIGTFLKLLGQKRTNLSQFYITAFPD